MKRTIALVLLSVAAANAEPPRCTSTTGRSVTVNGSASLRLAPDRVSFSVGVETLAAGVSEAFKANSSKVNAVVAALKAKGVESTEIQTSNLEVTSRDPEGKKLAGFRVTNMVTVTREDPSKVGELLQAAVRAGANEVGSLRFFVAEPGRLQSRGLDLAFQAARAKAEALAGYAKKGLGEAVCISETAPWQASNTRTNLSALGYVGGSPAVEVGTEELTFSVAVVFELK